MRSHSSLTRQPHALTRACEESSKDLSVITVKRRLCKLTSRFNRVFEPGFCSGLYKALEHKDAWVIHATDKLKYIAGALPCCASQLLYLRSEVFRYILHSSSFYFPSWFSLCFSKHPFCRLFVDTLMPLCSTHDQLLRADWAAPLN